MRSFAAYEGTRVHTLTPVHMHTCVCVTSRKPEVMVSKPLDGLETIVVLEMIVTVQLSHCLKVNADEQSVFLTTQSKVVKYLCSLSGTHWQRQ